MNGLGRESGGTKWVLKERKMRNLNLSSQVSSLRE